MLIILEGPDGAGKSTLARRLLRLCPGAQLLHRGPPLLHPLDEYEVPLTPDTICDRWHWGEGVYPTVLNRSSLLDSASWWHIESYLKARGALVVLVLASLETMTERLVKRGDHLIQPVHLPGIVEGYGQVAQRSQLPRITWEWQYQGVEHLLQVAHTAANLNAHLRPFQTYVGPHSPRFLLLGDTRRDPVRDRAAFQPRPGTSGRFLIDALPTVVRSSCGLANACDVDDPEALWRALGQPRVVALGAQAHKMLEAKHLPHGTVPHPQYVRRFYHERQFEYGDLILQALRDQEEHPWLSPT